MIIHHICIQTNNYKDSIDFYKNVLNFELINETANFNNRNYNSWLKLNDFMIELQTGKIDNLLKNYDSESEGIVHFCLFTDNFDEEFNRIENNKLANFKEKNGKKIYEVNGNRLFKLIAPEGTIIEIRDSMEI